MPTIKQRINAIVADEFRVAEAEVVPEAKLRDDLGADSLDMFELAVMLEDRFEDVGVEVPDEDIEGLVTVQDLYNYVNKQRR